MAGVWGPCFGEPVCSWGDVWLYLRKLLYSVVQSVFLYGAEAWGCLGTGPTESSTILLWCPTRIRCIRFWQDIDRLAIPSSIDTEIGLCSSDDTRKRPVDGKVENLC